MRLTHQDCGQSNVIPSSTNPDAGLTRSTPLQRISTAMVCQHLSPSDPEDIALAEKQHPQGKETIAAEDILHDIAPSIISPSDSSAANGSAMGEVAIRTWQDSGQDEPKAPSGERRCKR